MNDLSTDASAFDRASDLLKTGVPGLDDVLGGGLTCGRLYLVEGSPGTGKTLIVHLHELLTFLGQSGVATLLIGGQHGPPLRPFQGVLTGVPVSLGDADAGPENPSIPCPNS